MEEIYVSGLELHVQKWSLSFYKYILAIWDCGLANSFWNHVIHTFRVKNFHGIYSQH
jgi:hypothetical protein